MGEKIVSMVLCILYCLWRYDVVLCHNSIEVERIVFLGHSLGCCFLRCVGSDVP